jgi:glycerol kinase
MRFQADILGVPVQRNDTPELSALGAAYLAGLASGVWASTDEVAALPRSVVRFEPGMAAVERERLYGGWREALARAVLRLD